MTSSLNIRHSFWEAAKAVARWPYTMEHAPALRRKSHEDGLGAGMVIGAGLALGASVWNDFGLTGAFCGAIGGFVGGYKLANVSDYVRNINNPLRFVGAGEESHPDVLGVSARSRLQWLKHSWPYLGRKAITAIMRDRPLTDVSEEAGQIQGPKTQPTLRVFSSQKPSKILLDHMPEDVISGGASNDYEVFWSP